VEILQNKVSIFFQTAFARATRHNYLLTFVPFSV
jgi:hypothetical protein